MRSSKNGNEDIDDIDNEDDDDDSDDHAGALEPDGDGDVGDEIIRKHDDVDDDDKQN